MKYLAKTLQTVMFGTFLCLSLTFSQDKPGFSGHWEGAAKANGQEVAFTLDLMKNDKGEWVGSIAMAGGKGIPLGEVKVDGTSISMKLPMSSGPGLEAKLSEDEKTLTGTATQGGGSSTFELKRTGEPKVEVLPKSSILTADFEGNWEGGIETPGGKLRLVLKLSKAADRTASGLLDSVDQGATIPLSTITIDGFDLAFEIRMIMGDFKGKLNDTKSEIAGNWSQGGMTLPLTLKKAQSK